MPVIDLRKVLGKKIISAHKADVALSAPEHAGRDPEQFRSTVLLLEGGSRVLLKHDRLESFECSDDLESIPIDGAGEYKATGQTICGVWTNQMGNVYLELANGNYLTVNPNQGYYLEFYTTEDMEDLVSGDPVWQLTRML